MSQITHYSNPQSRGMRTQVLLDTFGIEHDFHLVDFANGHNRTESYLKVHPYGRVPALVDGNQTVIESGAITLYLADKFADRMNTPALNTPERTKMYEWLFFLHSTLEPIAIEFFAQQDKSASQGKVRDLLQAMSSRLGTPFVLGETFSFLDASLACELHWYKLVGIYPDGLTDYDTFLDHVRPKLPPAYGGTRPD